MTNITSLKTGALGLPADFTQRLATGIAESRSSTVIASGGKPLLRMLKSGEWVYGQSDEEVQEGSRWIVNLMTLSHGWCCWVQTAPNQKNELRGEVMCSMAEPKPPRPAPIDGTAFTEQRAFELKCMTGDDAGTEVLYKNGSVGGMRAVDGLLADIQVALAQHTSHPFPVLTLGMDNYQHPKWGRIYTPIFDIVGWADVDGRLLGYTPAPIAEQAPLQSAAPEEPPKRTRKRAAVAPEPVKPSDPISTTQVRATQRRRPGAQPPF